MASTQSMAGLEQNRQTFPGLCGDRDGFLLRVIFGERPNPAASIERCRRGDRWRNCSAAPDYKRSKHAHWMRQPFLPTSMITGLRSWEAKVLPVSIASHCTFLGDSREGLKPTPPESCRRILPPSRARYGIRGGTKIPLTQLFIPSNGYPRLDYSLRPNRQACPLSRTNEISLAVRA